VIFAKLPRLSAVLRSVRPVAACALIALCALPLTSMGASALELIMYDKEGCVWCARFDRDIGRNYQRSEAGQIAPLRRIDIRDQRRSGVELDEPVIYTPTFVLSDDDGVEVGRITGYQGEGEFWGRLDALLNRLPPRQRR
jgi:hypothetical protein